ncbi:MAG: hypothetical protein ACT4OF_01230 [Caulobacteraceae bacterium]
MSDQPPLEATLHAFKKRNRRFVLTGAAIAYYVLVLLVGAAFLALTWGQWRQVIAWYMGILGSISSGGEPGPPPQQVILSLAPYYLAGIPIGLLLFAAFEAACLRWLVRGEAGGGLFGLRLDADTWRVFGVYWLWIAYFLCVVIAIAVFYGLLAAFGALGGAARFIAILIGALAPIGIVALLIWGGVLFAPAAATSIGRRKLTFLSARRVSAPRYWPLLTSFFLVIVGYLIASTIVSTILQIPINAAMAPVMQAMLSGGDGAEALRLMQDVLLTPLMVTLLVVSVLISFVLATVYYIALFGVNARAFEAAAQAGDVTPSA